MRLIVAPLPFTREETLSNHFVQISSPPRRRWPLPSYNF